MPLSDDTNNSNQALSISQLTHAVSNDGSCVSNSNLTDHTSINLVSATSFSVSGNVGRAQIDGTVLPYAMSSHHLNTSAAMAPTTSTLRKTCIEESHLDNTPSTDYSIFFEYDVSRTNKSTLQHDPDNIIVSSKGLHICNLNIRHILPKIDEIKILLSHTQNALI